jgi:hypothetical protein
MPQSTGIAAMKWPGARAVIWLSPYRKSEGAKDHPDFLGRFGF